MMIMRHELDAMGTCSRGDPIRALLSLFACVVCFTPTIFGAVAGPSAQTGIAVSVTACQTLDQAGVTYQLQNDIVSDSETCFSITADHVTLDGNGHTVTASAGGYGVLVSPDGDRHATIKNLTLSGFSAGIFLFFADGNAIANNVIVNGDRGIYFFYSEGNTVTDNTIQENRYNDIQIANDTQLVCPGFLLNNVGSGNRPIGYFNSEVHLTAVDGPFSQLLLCGADGSTVTGLTVEGSADYQNNGILLSWSNDAIVDGVNSSGNNSGIRVVHSMGDTIRNNVLDSDLVGIDLYRAEDNLFAANAASNCDFGIRVGISGENTFQGNTVAYSNRAGYYDDPFYYDLANDLVDNVFIGSGLFDLLFNHTADSPSFSCARMITGNTGSGGSPIGWINTPGTAVDGGVFAQLFLCGADGATITGVTVAGSPSVRNNGLFVIKTTDARLTHVASSDNYIGVSFQASSGNTITDSTLAGNEFGLELRGSPQHRIFHNNIFGNISDNVWADQSDDLWDPETSEGNYWGHACPGALFTAGLDSNGLQVVDSHPYGQEDGWLAPGGAPGCIPPCPDSCSDGDPCTDDACDPATGTCTRTANTAPCDDGNACTLGDTCDGGSCQPGTPVVCDDNNVCTTDSCNPVTGCVFSNNTASCDDGNACTVGDTCGGGTCHPGTGTLTCNDNNPCTDDSCNSSTGCTHANNTAPCDDGNSCTVGEACRAGSCVPPVSFVQSATSPLGAGTTPYFEAAGDFNLDGKLDLAVANWNSFDVTILLGDGFGGFAEPAGSPFAVGHYPSGIAVGDFNVDGNPDLALANYTYGVGNVTILLGDGSGGFVQPAGSPFGAETGPSDVVVADFNLDGKPDLAVPNFGADNVTILLGDGVGGFVQPAGSPVGVGANPGNVAAGDFNLDGKPDLAVSNYTYGYGDVTVLLGDGVGGFAQAAGSPVAAGINPGRIGAWDLNGDGKLDLALVNRGSSDVTILLGNGLGAFAQPAGSPIGVGGDSPIDLAVGDLNLDGKPDLAITNENSNNVSILLGNGLGAFAQPPGWPRNEGAHPVGVVVGDFNLDGRSDLAVCNENLDNVTILLGAPISAPNGTACNDGTACTQTDTCQSGVCIGSNPVVCAASDQCHLAGTCDPGTGICSNPNALDGLHCDDGVACTSNATCRSGVCLAAVAFTEPATSPVGTGSGPSFEAVGDFNLDGKADLAVVNFFSDNVTILLGDGSGGFAESAGSPFAVGHRPLGVAVSDFNVDGALDLAVANYTYGSGSVTILLGDGSGGFAQPAGSPVGVGVNPFGVAARDFNRDGKPDLAVPNFGSDTVTVLLGDGSGGFAQPAGSPIDVGANPYGVVTGDFNHDFKPDLAVSNYSYGYGSVTILLGNGSGGFAQAVGSPYAVEINPGRIVAWDLNGDAMLDLALVNTGSQNVTILLGNGLGGFAQPSGSPIGTGGATPLDLAVGDLNLDGKPDLVVTNENSYNVTILLGHGSGGFAQAAGSPREEGTNPLGVVVEDFNHDGRPDLAVSNENDNSVTILLGAASPAPNGTACNDGNGCTVNDACAGGACTGTTIVVPGPVTGLVYQSDKQTLVWNSAAPAGPGTVHDVSRGVVNELPVGSGGSERCLTSGISAATTMDAEVPTPGMSFWYVARGRNSCGAGIYGFDSSGSVEVTGVCP